MSNYGTVEGLWFGGVDRTLQVFGFSCSVAGSRSCSVWECSEAARRPLSEAGAEPSPLGGCEKFVIKFPLHASSPGRTGGVRSVLEI